MGFRLLFCLEWIVSGEKLFLLGVRRFGPRKRRTRREKPRKTSRTRCKPLNDGHFLVNPVTHSLICIRSNLHTQRSKFWKRSLDGRSHVSAGVLALSSLQDLRLLRFFYRFLPSLHGRYRVFRSAAAHLFIISETEETSSKKGEEPPTPLSLFGSFFFLRLSTFFPRWTAIKRS